MIPYERRKRMLEELSKKEIIDLDELVAALRTVSKSTVRRDLKILSDEGQIIMLRGGAVKLKSGSFDTPLNSRSILHVREKEIIAKRAAELVKDGEVIYIDSGTTPFRMLKYLRSKRITVVTTSTVLITELEGSRLDCIIIGGQVNKATASIVGPITDNLLREMHFDKAFIGASGFDPVAGITTPDYQEANKKRIVKNNAKTCYVLADSSKEGKVTMCKALELGDVVLITERISESLAKYVQHILAEE
ncbi:MAG: DeoR/GlpR family DNA-binding transcription regulator [Candidatus Limiplasma sp.]|nr:DeoR/GlpR family DNA-binding transcription regulator [Candidatus Limiplasma sp.]MEA5146091.1 DeoR/GlpR family DNA-binding transcription regulator [Candidatus Limiplasma sp.]